MRQSSYVTEYFSRSRRFKYASRSRFTFSCHSIRHLIGGRLNCYPETATGNLRYRLWSIVSILNKRHMLFAWLSLFMVGFADFYVWMVASGRFTDSPFFS